jgi:hypothetical protein
MPTALRDLLARCTIRRRLDGHPPRELGPAHVGEVAAEGRARDGELHHEAHATGRRAASEPVVRAVPHEAHVALGRRVGLQQTRPRSYRRDPHRPLGSEIHREIAVKGLFALSEGAAHRHRLQGLVRDAQRVVGGHRVVRAQPLEGHRRGRERIVVVLDIRSARVPIRRVRRLGAFVRAPAVGFLGLGRASWIGGRHHAARRLHRGRQLAVEGRCREGSRPRSGRAATARAGCCRRRSRATRRPPAPRARARQPDRVATSWRRCGLGARWAPSEP